MDDYIILKSERSVCTTAIADNCKLRNKCVILNDNETVYVILKKTILKKSSKTFTDYIIRDYVFFLIYNYVTKSDLDAIIPDLYKVYNKIIKQILVLQKNKIRDLVNIKLNYFINCCSMINIDGFLRFALREFDEQILDIADEYITEILAEEELNELIDILKFYLETEPCEYGLLNVNILKDGSYKYYDRYYNDITAVCINAVHEELYGNDCSQDEILISVLVGLNPEEIIIHNIANTKNQKLMQTIKAVFTEKVKICDSECNFCNS